LSTKTIKKLLKEAEDIIKKARKLCRHKNAYDFVDGDLYANPSHIVCPDCGATKPIAWVNESDDIWNPIRRDMPWE
jgi:hypothetical protein